MDQSWDSKHQKEEEPTHVVDVERPEEELASSDPSNVIGISSRVNGIMSYLGTDSDDVRFIGIWGMGGIGKTTLARVVYDKISNQFPHHYFYDNVREVSRRNGQVGLQRVLLLRLQTRSTGSLGIHNTEEGTNELNNLFYNKKVLLVLDGVNDICQLRNLAGTPKWFGAGSRIIITTRDMSLLRSHEVRIYKIEALNDDESLQLFSRNAFNRDYPEENYLSLSLSVVQYTGGLPLALQVLGSSVSTKIIPQWREALVEWKQHPHEIILETLKISYEELTEKNKAIFLHIACFFGGWKNKMTEVLKNYGLDDPRVELGLRVLVDKALIIEEDNCLEMHSLLQQLGRSIVLEGGTDILLRIYTGPNGVCRSYKIEIHNVWRIVGLVSSAVGVVTYAGSSSFNLLWGEGKWWTVFLYCLFSFIICCVMLIAPKLSQLHVLKKPWVKPLLTFMVLILTTLYSFYHEKHMTKKPDALSPISSSAFALMSMSLSKQIELELELGVSLFWLGLMMQQLMKIKLILVLVAAVICSFFTAVHSNWNTQPQTRIARVGPINENGHSILKNDNFNPETRSSSSRTTRD